MSIYDFSCETKNLFDEGCSMGKTARTRASGVLFELSAGILRGFVPVYIHFLG